MPSGASYRVCSRHKVFGSVNYPRLTETSSSSYFSLAIRARTAIINTTRHCQETTRAIQRADLLDLAHDARGLPEANFERCTSGNNMNNILIELAPEPVVPPRGISHLAETHATTPIYNYGLGDLGQSSRWRPILGPELVPYWQHTNQWCNFPSVHFASCLIPVSIF